jgi:tetratricopeptide (TPR) repeat protein
MAAKEALAIDDTLAEAHAGLGVIALVRDWDWPGAERAMETALELNANSVIAHWCRACLAATMLDSARALREIARTIELDPLNLHVRCGDAEFCYWIRDYRQVEEYVSQVLDLDPGFPRAHFVLGRVREAEGRIADAITEYERAGVITADLKGARRALRQGGPTAYHRWVLRAGTAGMPQAGSLTDRPFYQARIHARLGEVDLAMTYLEQAYAERDSLLVMLKAVEWCDPLRSDPRFADLVRRVGIP